MSDSLNLGCNSTKDIKFLEIKHLNGPNMWTYYPALEATVDIGELEDFPSDKIPGFYERLSEWSFRQHARLLDLAAEATGDGCFGLHLAAREVDIRDAGLLAYVGLSSRTLGEAVRNLARYGSVLNEAIRGTLELSEDSADLVIEVLDPSVRNRRQAVEFSAANVVRGCRMITRTELRPSGVRFAHPRNHEVDQFERFPAPTGRCATSRTTGRRRRWNWMRRGG